MIDDVLEEKILDPLNSIRGDQIKPLLDRAKKLVEIIYDSEDFLNALEQKEFERQKKRAEQVLNPTVLMLLVWIDLFKKWAAITPILTDSRVLSIQEKADTFAQIQGFKESLTSLFPDFQLTNSNVIRYICSETPNR